MAKITISELRPAGAELFEGSESFMSELTDAEMDYINGGGEVGICFGWSFIEVTVKF